MRSCWKIPFINKKYFEKCFLKKRIFKIKYKNSIISHNFLDKKVFIYNGRHSKSLNILSSMIGYKFGEFILVKTSKIYIHLKKSKKKTKQSN